MSIASEITRLQTAKSDLKTAIEGKGVTVASSALLDDYADLVDAIQTGGGGGGSGAISLLGTVTVPSDTRAVNIDLTAYQSYNFFFIYIDLKLNQTDWLYLVKNGSEPTDGSYGNSIMNHTGIVAAQFDKPAGTGNIVSFLRNNNTLTVSVGAMTNMYVYTYVDTKYIKAGGIFKIYGGNYADM